MTMRTSAKKTKAYFKEKQVSYNDTTIPVGDRDIHYIQTGNETAPTLVFIHGSPGSWDAYKAYLTDTDLLEKFRIIAPDRPGFGYSNFRRSMGLQPQASMLNTLLREVDNGEPYTLIGHSYGGPLIVKMALEAPGQYENLMILAGALDPDAEKPEKWRKPLMWFPLKYLVPGSLRPSNDELWLLKQELIDMQSELGKLTENVTIIHGTADKLVPYQNVPFMEREFVNVKTLNVISLENERHFIVWDREKLIKETIIKWVKH